MEWRLSGLAQAIYLPFMVDGQFAVPDSASIRLTVRGHDGSVLTGYDQAPQADVTSTQITINLPADINTLDPTTNFSARYVRLDFTVGGVPQAVNYAYRLHAFIPMTVSPNFVRSLVGADYEELPDQDIDLVSAYFSLLNSYGNKITTALSRADISNDCANQAIGLTAAIALCPSMPSRILKSEKQDNAGFVRYDIDFANLEANLRGQLSNSLDAITKTLDGTTATVIVPNLFAVSSQTDRITGASS